MARQTSSWHYYTRCRDSLVQLETVAFIEPTRSLGRSFVLRGHERMRMQLVFVLAVAAPLAAFIAFGLKAWQRDAFTWDAELSARVRTYGNRESVVNRSMDLLGFVLHPGIQVIGALLIFAAVLALVARGRPRAALMLGLSAGGAAVGAPLLKELFGSTESAAHAAGYSFPSGHALRTMAVAAALTIVAWPTAWRRTTAVLGGIIVVLMGVALVYHEWHWASDVIAGWCLGIAWVACVWLALRLVSPPAQVGAEMVVDHAARARERDAPADLHPRGR